MKNRALVLGESHYGSDDESKSVGDFVDYDTKDVVRNCLDMKKDGSGTYWARFFDLIAESFGYEDYAEFYSMSRASDGVYPLSYNKGHHMAD